MKLQFLLALNLLFVKFAFGQVKIGDNGTIVNPNSLLELESTNKGLLLPRVVLLESTNPFPLTQHIAGMTLFNTASNSDLTPGYYYNDGVKWIKLASAPDATNGLTIQAGNQLKLGGILSESTTIVTSPVNTFSISGLQNGNSLDSVVLLDPISGVLKKASISSLIVEKQVIYTAQEGENQFSTPFVFSNIEKVNVYRNGARIGAKMLTNTSIQLEDGVICVNGDEIRIVQLN
jgi:hypothetical protein